MRWDFCLLQIDAVSGRKFSFHQLKDQTRRFSSALTKKDFRKGDVLAMYLPNVIEYPIIFYGVANLGGIVTTLNPRSSQDDLVHFLKLSRAKFLVTTPPLAEKAFSAGLLEEIHSVFVIGETENCESLSSLLADDGTAFPQDVRISPKEDIVALPFSSGTTGLSKGVMLTHHNLIAQVRILFRDRQPIKDTEAMINVLPLYHIYGLAIIMGARLYLGNTMVLMSRFEPSVFLQALQEYKVSFIEGWETGKG